MEQTKATWQLIPKAKKKKIKKELKGCACRSLTLRVLKFGEKNSILIRDLAEGKNMLVPRTHPKKKFKKN